jgi:hypothetical protein
MMDMFSTDCFKEGAWQRAGNFAGCFNLAIEGTLCLWAFSKSIPSA